MGYLQIILLLVLSLSVCTVRSNLDADDAGDTIQDVVDTAQDLTNDQGEESMPGANESNPNAEEPAPEAPRPKAPRVETVGNDAPANSFKTRCQMCDVTKEDSGTTHIYDTYTKKNVIGRCEEHECANGLDWCLVTYYEHRSSPNSPYDEIRQYECGNKAMRDSSSICDEIKRKGNTAQDYFKVQECQTKRSSSSNIGYSSLLVAIAVLLASKLLLN